MGGSSLTPKLQWCTPERWLQQGLMTSSRYMTVLLDRQIFVVSTSLIYHLLYVLLPESVAAYCTPIILRTLQIKAMDNGIPQKWSTVQLRVEWIRKLLPFPQALQFMVSNYKFIIAENAKVFENVGTIFVRQTETPLWFDIIGEL